MSPDPQDTDGASVSARIIGDSWYAEALGIDSLDDAVRRPGSRRLLGSGPGRGVLLWLAARRYDAVALPLAGSAMRTLLILDRILGRRRGRYLVVLEFIPVVGTTARRRWGATSRLRTLRADAFWTWVGGPSLRRHLLVAQSLTRWEIDRNAAQFGLDRDRLRFIPFFMATDEPESPVEPGRGVLASGRAACDWETIFSAAAGQDWSLTAVCAASDLDRVTALNADGRATVLCEIDSAEHARLVREAAVYLLALEEAAVSSGQVRLLDAAVAGTAVAASEVRGLADYLSVGETALSFTPGDALGARTAVNQLLEDPALRARIVEGARDRGRRWRRADYLRAIRELVEGAAVESAVSGRRSGPLEQDGGAGRSQGDA